MLFLFAKNNTCVENGEVVELIIINVLYLEMENVLFKLIGLSLDSIVLFLEKNITRYNTI